MPPKKASSKKGAKRQKVDEDAVTEKVEDEVKNSEVEKKEQEIIDSANPEIAESEKVSADGGRVDDGISNRFSELQEKYYRAKAKVK